MAGVSRNALNVGQNPLLNHGGPVLSVVESLLEEIIYIKAANVKTPMRVIFNAMCKIGLMQMVTKEEKDTCDERLILPLVNYHWLSVSFLLFHKTYFSCS